MKLELSDYAWEKEYGNKIKGQMSQFGREVINNPTNEDIDLIKYNLLTETEKKVAIKIAQGFSYKDICNGHGNCVQKTVEKHIDSIYKKFRVNDRLAAARIMYRLGIVKP
jgi:DNA-binding NarL/FixJ family response regulator